MKEDNIRLCVNQYHASSEVVTLYVYIFISLANFKFCRNSYVPYDYRYLLLLGGVAYLRSNCVNNTQLISRCISLPPKE